MKRLTGPRILVWSAYYDGADAPNGDEYMIQSEQVRGERSYYWPLWKSSSEREFRDVPAEFGPASAGWHCTRAQAEAWAEWHARAMHDAMAPEPHQAVVAMPDNLA